MSHRVVQNFRGKRALILHRADGNRERLIAALHRLGLSLVDEADKVVDDAEPVDVLFFDADENASPVPARLTSPDTAWIALIGVEAPGRLAEVVRSECCSHIVKPVRASGVYSALFIGVNELHRRRRDSIERERLIERVNGRRAVTKAVLKLMRTHDLNDDEAFRVLRDESMRLRLSLEVMAERCMEDEHPADQTLSLLDRRTT